MELFLDIETIPSQLPWVHDYVDSTISPPGNYKKEESIAKWNVEERPAVLEDALSKCAFDGAMNQIVCIGVAKGDGLPKAFLLETNEEDLLRDFYDHIGHIKPGINIKLVGHNIVGFDLRVLKQRSMVLGVRPPAWLPFDAKPWEAHAVYDTMTQWDSKNFAKLDKLARAFGIDGKSMDGSQVYQMWKDGKHQEIADYCVADVELTRKVYRRMTFGN